MSPADLPFRQWWLLLGVFLLGVFVGGGAMVADISVGPSKSQSAPTKQFTNVTQCTTISTPGRYALRRNVGGSIGLSDSCIVVNSSNVLLDGFGHEVGGRGVTNSTGITITNRSGVSNVTVQTVKLTNWNRGMLVQNASGVHLRRVNVSNNAESIAFWNASGSSLKKSRFEGNLIGVVVDNESRDVTVQNNEFEENHGSTVVWGRSAQNPNAQNESERSAALASVDRVRR